MDNKSITYIKIKKGYYKTTINDVVYYVTKLLSGRWSIQTFDEIISGERMTVIRDNKKQCTHDLYKIQNGLLLPEQIKKYLS